MNKYRVYFEGWVEVYSLDTKNAKDWVTDCIVQMSDDDVDLEIKEVDEV